MQAKTEAPPVTAASVRQARVVQIKPEGENTACLLSHGSAVLVSNVLAAHIRPGDDIHFPLSLDSDGARTEVYIGKPSPRNRDVYQAHIGYAAQPKHDKREEPYVRAEVAQGRLGISAIYFPCNVLRDQFYVADRCLPWEKQRTLYEILRVPVTASPAELRLAFKLRQMELRAEGASKTAFAASERAFNILACPELRSCYESLLSNPLAPALFPYGGFGSIVALGDRSRDGQTFFVRRIVSFLPETTQRRFHAPLRNIDFYDDHAIYRDSRRKLEVWLDHSAMPVVWDATWNQWKHLLGAKIEVSGIFMEGGKYRHRGGEWHLLKGETALPSRLEVKLPPDIAEQVDTARRTYHRFGQFSGALGHIRARIDREPVEREELRRLCWNLNIPCDFDVAQINWRPDYDPFFYHQLRRRARRLYLFREEYIFDLARVIAVETPRLGHATYLFAKQPSMEAFLAAYIRVTKEDIRRNRGNAAELLGFLGRIVHGANPRAWVKELNSRSELL